MDVEPVAPARRLRIAVLGDFDGVHTRSWVRWFIARGHEVHAISYYRPRIAIEGAVEHALHRSKQTAMRHGAPVPYRQPVAASRLPLGAMRLVHALRYRRAGIRRMVRWIAPDVFHAHFVVEHGFYGAQAGYHPYVVSAWGSDVLVEPERDAISKRIARWTVGRADLVTSNNAHMADRIVQLGAPREKVEVVTLGAERFNLARADASVNRRGREAGSPRTIISTRAHEPLYNVVEIIEAYGRVAGERNDARLVVAHGGALTDDLRRAAAAAGGRIDFIGFLDRAAFRDALADAEVFVSVPESDATSVALLQAMGAGCFPIVSDLPSQAEWIEDGVNGFRVPLHRPDVLAERIARALKDDDLRRRAADANLRLVEERGLNETQMARMEQLYLRLAGRS